MLDNLININNNIFNQKILFIKSQFNDVFQKYIFVYINDVLKAKDEKKEIINENIKDSKLIIIDQNEKLNQETSKENLIIGFVKR